MRAMTYTVWSFVFIFAFVIGAYAVFTIEHPVAGWFWLGLTVFGLVGMFVLAMVDELCRAIRERNK